MSRRFINQLGERESIDQVFLVSEKQLRANRNGNLYLQLRLTDKTGTVTGMLWNANEKVAEGFEAGCYLMVQATTQFYNGALQLIVSKVNRVDDTTIDPADFVTLSNADVEQLASKLSESLRTMTDINLLNLAECFLMDDAFMAKFVKAPAGIRNHHAYPGGLLEHVISLMELAKLVANQYEQIDSDQLLMGAFLHDVGKIDELLYERQMSYSDEGQLIGHLVMGAQMIDDKVKETEKLSGEPFPAELALRLKHMVLSHHGTYEFGSPKLPMTLEAIALHFLDNLDSKIHSVTQLMAEDATTESHWTTYQPAIDRKIFKGAPKSE